MKAIRWNQDQLDAFERRKKAPIERMPMVIPSVATNCPTKYRSVAVDIGGEHYQSTKEAKRHQQLKLLVASGAIRDLVRHPTFRLAPKVQQEGEKKATPALRYEADFMYVEDGRLVVEDVKGLKTRVYKMKRHLMATILGITIKET